MAQMLFHDVSLRNPLRIPTQAYLKEAGGNVRFIRVFLSLYSIQLIIISALLITYLAVTTGSPTNTQHEIAPVTEREGLRAMVADVDRRNGDDGTRTATPRPFAIEGDLEAWGSLEMARSTGEIIGISDVKIAPEKKANEGGTNSVPERLRRSGIVMSRDT
jgi:hypothetical protein